MSDLRQETIFLLRNTTYSCLFHRQPKETIFVDLKENTTPVRFFFAVLSSGTAWVFPWVGFVCSTSALAAEPFVAMVVGLLFMLSRCFVFVVRDEHEREGAVGDSEDGGSPPLSPQALRDVDAAAAAGDDDGDDDDDEETEARALSRLHSSLWPARHAALWQASLQYFRCRHPEQKRSCWSWAGLSQIAQDVAWLMMSACSWSNSEM